MEEIKKIFKCGECKLLNKDILKYINRKKVCKKCFEKIKWRLKQERQNGN